VAADADSAFAELAAELRPGDIALFKSSRDSGLRWLGERVAGAAQ
jgi:UDP-N-acetylmuramoyl-tripeptide--D-alanyl-D-alanine ligase